MRFSMFVIFYVMYMQMYKYFFGLQNFFSCFLFFIVRYVHFVMKRTMSHYLPYRTDDVWVLKMF